MSEPLKIPVKLTLKDLWAFSFARSRARVIDKVMLGFCLFLILLVGLFLGISLFTEGNIESVRNIFIPFSFCVAAILLPGTLQYLMHRSNYQKSKLLSNLQCYEFLDEGLKSSSASGNSTVKWPDVFKVQELKPCFVIFLSPLKYILIPKRCLHSPEELEQLRRIMIQNIEGKKRILKKYRLGKTAPDKDESSVTQPITSFPEESTSDPFMEFSYHLTRQEQLEYNYQLYYTHPVGIILTLVGLGIVVFNLIGLMTTGVYNPDLLFFALAYLILVPILIYVPILRQYKHDPTLKLKYSFTLYETKFLLRQPSGEARIEWRDLVRSKEVGSGLLLYITTQLVYYIPRRVFAANPAEYEKLKQFIRSKVPSKPRGKIF